MQTIRLPRLGGTREAADALLDATIGPLEPLRGEPIVLLGRDLLSSSESFADQLVKRLLDEEHVSEIVMVAPPRKFEAYIRQAAERRGHPGRIRKDSAARVAV